MDAFIFLFASVFCSLERVCQSAPPKLSQNAYNYGRIEPQPANPIGIEQRMHAYNGSGRYNAMKIK